MSVSFIIPALNEEKQIGQCLQAIDRLRWPGNVRDIEVIVVDNQSTDRTAQVSRENGARVVQVSPGTVAGARNEGARLATGNWLAFVDADSEVAADWLEICGAHLTGESPAVAAASVLRSPGRDSPWVQQTWFELSHGSETPEVSEVRWLPAFNLLVNRSAFESVGGFDASLTTCEDSDLGYKLSDLGRLILDSRTSTAHHGESCSLGELFCREAWRTRGNVRLVAKRPLDWRNWASLLLPPSIMALFAAGLGGWLVALAAGWPSWPWLSAMVAAVFLVTVIVLRRAGVTGLSSFFKQVAVYGTYLAGRTVGLFWPYRRVER